MGQARPTINLDAFGDRDAEPTPTPPAQPQLWVRSIPEIAKELVVLPAHAKPGLLRDCREFPAIS
jgi:hypothetical protein